VQTTLRSRCTDLKVLRVLNVAYPFAPVGPDAVGGAEQVLSALDNALVADGHRSFVLAPEGSVTAGALVPIPRCHGSDINDSVRDARYSMVRQAITSSVLEIDLVHLHGVDFHAYLPPAGRPVLVTLHLPISWYPENALHPKRPGTWFNCVSHSQHRTCPPGVNLVPPIPNGVPVDALSQGPCPRRGYAIMLGRICPEKGQHLALQAAHRANVALGIAGEVFPYPEHRAYFERCVRPRLDKHRRYLGPVGFARKRRLLSSASCLLVPSLCPETSSLVAMEALACGTPVIAFPVGALPESIDHGRTGFLVENVEQMAAAIHQAITIDRAICRQTARERFSVRRMTNAYIELYRRLAACAG
jgi:glycosyltransferase involved in cell wall biosynthesis